MIKLFSHSFYTITGKYHEQPAILLMTVNLAVLRIAIVARIPVSGNRKNQFLGQVGSRLNKYHNSDKYYRTKNCTVNQPSIMTAHIVLYKRSIVFQLSIIFQLSVIVQISIMRTKRAL